MGRQKRCCETAFPLEINKYLSLGFSDAPPSTGGHPPSEIPLMSASKLPSPFPPELWVYDLKRPSPVGSTPPRSSPPGLPVPTGQLGSSPPDRELLRCVGVRLPRPALRSPAGEVRRGQHDRQQDGSATRAEATTTPCRLPSAGAWAGPSPGRGPAVGRGLPLPQLRPHSPAPRETGGGAGPGYAHARCEEQTAQAASSALFLLPPQALPPPRSGLRLRTQPGKSLTLSAGRPARGLVGRQDGGRDALRWGSPRPFVAKGRWVSPPPRGWCRGAASPRGVAGSRAAPAISDRARAVLSQPPARGPLLPHRGALGVKLGAGAPGQLTKDSWLKQLFAAETVSLLPSFSLGLLSGSGYRCSCMV